MRKIIRIHRLGQVIIGPLFKRFDGSVYGGITGQHNDDYLRIDIFDSLLKLHPINTRHLYVQENDIPMTCLEFFQSLSCVRS